MSSRDNLIIEAFATTCEGYSTDRVIADPDMNLRYLAKCQELKIDDTPENLNQHLLNLRKRGALSGRPRAKRTIVRNQDEYQFAAEMTVRFLERRDNITLDRILCSPLLAEEFDELSWRIAPGFLPLEYRWAALSLRKASRLSPEILARVAPPKSLGTFTPEEIRLQNLESTPALYLFYDSNQLLYVGETENIRSRMKKHLDHSDNKGLARWMWEHGMDGLHIEIQYLPQGVSTKVRRALEVELIRSRNPLFNVKR